jgi:hypothetical protein
MYGQYSPNGGARMTHEDKRANARAFGPVATIRNPTTCTAHNRYIARYFEGVTRFFLHRTPVVTLDGETVTLDDGGYPTMTTRRAMAEGVKELTGCTVNVWGEGDGCHQVNGKGLVLSFSGKVTFLLSALEG